MSAAVHCNFFLVSAAQNPWFIHYEGSRSIDQLCENEHLTQWLPSFNTDNISRSSIWSTGILQNITSATKNRGQRTSLWHFKWLSRDITKCKGLHSNGRALVIDDRTRYKYKVLYRTTYRIKFQSWSWIFTSATLWNHISESNAYIRLVRWILLYLSWKLCSSSPRGKCFWRFLVDMKSRPDWSRRCRTEKRPPPGTLKMNFLWDSKGCAARAERDESQ